MANQEQAMLDRAVPMVTRCRCGAEMERMGAQLTVVRTMVLIRQRCPERGWSNFWRHDDGFFPAAPPYGP